MEQDDIINQALMILESRLSQPEGAIRRPDDVSDYLRLKLGALEHESFRIMFLNTQHSVITLKELFRGSIDCAAVYPREVMKETLQFNAAAVVLTHNHPSGFSGPSQADKYITKRIQEALELIDVKVLDHVIVGRDDTYSFAQHGLL